MIVDQKIMRFDMKQFAIRCYLRMVPVVIITLCLGIVINYFIVDKVWLILAMKAVIVICIYMIAVLAFGITNQERKNIFSKIKLK